MEKTWDTPRTWDDLNSLERELAVRHALGILMCSGESVTWAMAEHEARRAIYPGDDGRLIITLDPVEAVEPCLPVEEPCRRCLWRGDCSFPVGLLVGASGALTAILTAASVTPPLG